MSFADRFRRFQEKLVDGKKGPFIFLLTTFLFGVSINLVSGCIASPESGCHPAKPLWITGALLGPAFVLIVMNPLWTWLLSWRSRSELVSSVQKATPSRGLVVLASPGAGIDTARKAVEFHLQTLEKLWILCSTGSPNSSEPDARSLRDEFAAKDSFLAQVQVVTLWDEQFKNPETVKNTIEAEVFNRLPEGLKASDVMIDITGGRKGTTAGALLAALSNRGRLEVIEPSALDIRGRGTAPEKDPQEIRIAYEVRRIR